MAAAILAGPKAGDVLALVRRVAPVAEVRVEVDSALLVALHAVASRLLDVRLSRREALAEPLEVVPRDASVGERLHARQDGRRERSGEGPESSP